MQINRPVAGPPLSVGWTTKSPTTEGTRWLGQSEEAAHLAVDWHLPRSGPVDARIDRYHSWRIQQYLTRIRAKGQSDNWNPSLV